MDEKLKEYNQLINDIWKLIKKYSVSNQNDQYWQSYCEEIEELHKKYNKSEFSKALLLAVTDEMERISK